MSSILYFANFINEFYFDISYYFNITIVHLVVRSLMNVNSLLVSN